MLFKMTSKSVQTPVTNQFTLIASHGKPAALEGLQLKY